MEYVIIYILIGVIYASIIFGLLKSLEPEKYNEKKSSRNSVFIFYTLAWPAWLMYSVYVFAKELLS